MINPPLIEPHKEEKTSNTETLSPSKTTTLPSHRKKLYHMFAATRQVENRIGPTHNPQERPTKSRITRLLNKVSLERILSYRGFQ